MPRPRWKSLVWQIDYIGSDNAENSDDEENVIENSTDSDEAQNRWPTQEMSTDSISKIEHDMKTLSDVCLIDSEVKARFRKLQKSLPSLNRLPSTSIPMFSNSLATVSQDVSKKATFTPLLELKIGQCNRSVYIRKSTAYGCSRKMKGFYLIG